MNEPTLYGRPGEHTPLLIMRRGIGELTLALVDADNQPIIIDPPLLRDDTPLVTSIGLYWEWQTPELAAGTYTLHADFVDDEQVPSHMEFIVEVAAPVEMEVR